MKPLPLCRKLQRWDPYCDLMTAKEIGASANPYREDYYYQVLASLISNLARIYCLQMLYPISPRYYHH